MSPGATWVIFHFFTTITYRFIDRTVSRQKYPNVALWPPRQHDHSKHHEAVDTATHVQIE
jgi:hypothetical protein